jgi:intracellular septation protein A
MCTTFMGEIFTATHNFGVAPTRGTSAADSFKAALYLTTATVDANTSVYSATNEVTGSGYTAGGVTVTFGTAPSTSGTTAFVTPSASIVYSSVTLTTAFDAVLIYNSTQSNKAVSVHTFGSQTVTAGTFTLTMPVNDASTGLIRIA